MWPHWNPTGLLLSIGRGYAIVFLSGILLRSADSLGGQQGIVDVKRHGLRGLISNAF